ncbi:MAG: Ig-like domain-containing protein, partial [Cyanobacteriota bacterium]|nr:Ig-like domain-containing protein [Cyanobacteriota bacterium]
LSEAPNGVNAAEAASSGGTPLTITLPADALPGDSVTTTVTKPDGSSLPLTTVLTAAQISAGQIIQVVPTANLDQQGTWSTSTVVTDVAGNKGPATGGSFLLDTIVPLSPTGTDLPEGPQVNLADATSNGGTPLVVDLPANALVGETVTTLVTKPGGATLTLSTVLTAADLAAGSITQTIPTADLSPDGNWTTSTTLVDPSGNVSPASTNSFSLDVTPPTIAITSNRTSLIAGQTATITFTLSEASSDFTVADVSVSGGTLSGFAGSGTTYTATFTPTNNSTTDGVVSVASGAFNDGFANPNADGGDANNTVTMTVDTRVSATITSAQVTSTSTTTTNLGNAYYNFNNNTGRIFDFYSTGNGDISYNNGAFSGNLSGDGGSDALKINNSNNQTAGQSGYAEARGKDGLSWTSISFTYYDLQLTGQQPSDNNWGFGASSKVISFHDANGNQVGSYNLTQNGSGSGANTGFSASFGRATSFRISGGNLDLFTIDNMTLGNAQQQTTVTTTPTVTNGGSQAPTSGTLSGTVTRALVSGETVAILRDGTPIGNATVSGTNWTFNYTIAAGTTDVFTAQVQASGTPITTSSGYTITQSAGGVTPLALDLNGDGIQTLSLESGVAFDIDADGQAESVGWLSDGDAWLGLDRNGNGSLDSGAELFGNHTPLQGGGTAAEGFAALADLDSNSDLNLDAADARYGELLLWSDRNRDGVSQADELTGLAQAGVVSIALDGLTDAATRQNGNWLGLSGSFRRSDGSLGAITDVWVATVEPSVDPLDPTRHQQHPLLGSTPPLV